MKKLCRFGTHRVIEPLGSLPQSARKLDNTMVCFDNEILCEVETLNIDSASFTQIRQTCHDDVEQMKTMILSIVEKQGKMQNPVTGSGGMFLGRIKEIGSQINTDIQVGDTIASLVSLSLTPLKIQEITAIHLEKDQVDIIGEAILFATGIYAKIPQDLPPHIVLATLDVCGAPAQVSRLVKKGDDVLILGAAGKSGLLTSFQARKSSETGRVLGVVYTEQEKADLTLLNVCDEIIVGDAREPMSIYNEVIQKNGKPVDIAINVVNVENTEMTAILPTKNNGIVYFFSMATSFTKAALGAEGIASEAQMIIGNGYTKGHAELALNILRESPQIYHLFEQRYGKESL